MTTPSSALTEALRLLSGAGTWHELRQSLSERGLDKSLSAPEIEALLDAWHCRSASALDDRSLLNELRFWHDGGTFSSHLQGFQAVPPEALVAEAETRGWFVRILGSGAVVNPPEGKPLMIRSLALSQPGND